MTLYSRDTVSIDEDHRFVTSQISNCIASDQYIPEFFESSIAVELHYNKIEKENSIATISDVKKYPTRVYNAATAAKYRVFMSSFPKLSTLYCVVDNTLYMWPFNNGENPEVITADGNIITTVTYGIPEPKIFNKNPTYVILIATDRTIKIVPAKPFQIYKDEASQMKISTIFVSSYISSKGEIFLCSDTGEVYLVKYKDTKSTQEAPGLKLKPLISPLWFIPMANLLKNPRRTTSMAVDDTHNYFAFLVGKTIRFYKYQNEHLYYLSKEKIDYSGNITNIEAIPISDSLLSHFVAFSTNGDRFFFGTFPGLYRNPDEIHLRRTLPAPEVFQGHTLISGSFSHGMSSFLFKDMFAILHPNSNPHHMQSHLVEDLVTIPLSPDCLSFFRSEHIYKGQNTSMFHNEYLWQHIVQPTPGFLQCADGYRIVNFKLPVDNLNDLLQEYKGNFTDPIREWMFSNAAGGEACAASIILAGRSPELQRWALHTMHQFTKLNNQRYERFLGNLSHVTMGFIVRIERLLTPIWRSTLFTKFVKKSDNSKMKWIINPIFNELPSNTIENFRDIFKLGDDYMRLRRSSIEANDPDMQKEVDEETTNIYRIYTYVSSIIETLKFMQIIKTLKTSVIDGTIQIVSEAARMRLTILDFGDENKYSIFDALREFAASLFSCKDGPSRGDRFSMKLARECPFFFSEAASLIKQAIEDLKSARYKQTVISQPIIERCIDTFVKYADQIPQQNLQEITDIFTSLQDYKAIVDISLARAELIDPTHLALTWYKSDRSSTQSRETAAFDKRYECYVPLLKLSDVPDAFEKMLESNDETFHVVLYSYILQEKDEDSKEKLLSVSTPYLVSFLEEKYPDLLYLYNARHHDYATAAARLMELAKSKSNDIDIEKRIQYLRKVTTYARASRMSTVYTEAIDLLHPAEIQRDLFQGKASNELLSNQQLFDSCLAENRFDLILRLLPFLTIAGNANKMSVVSLMWSRFFEQNQGLSLLELKRKVLAIARSSESGTKEILEPSILIPLLEDTKLIHGGEMLWAVKVLDEMKSPLSNALAFYNSALANTEITQSQRTGFLAAIKYLLQKGATLRGRDKNFQDRDLLNL
ncbi:hypothetical protein TVAG_232720 [Trichomonas vaginalis G3]|uniref:Nucleoporin Nup133/Nup155-like N-terminal domain-containing protein n=1 Tax=Trichomonas vaginalis (strain ATCC PRA-98 / G3) TaxID=412133 RepID=A2EUA2_TRIV3|nr:nuclear pore complex protein NUP155 family [Trichomonas vaginalis G3]EAY03789.1 hypothetical protein TVAG_232720 [Trichomonas vaginalis G3]KAI5494242.1 nuclear pore complex protein NUP155 family [Trichomonas vaginalis G3]|eukprot:XP_001316012.1 hypothetical protein [Trichomonas vaginalis G3]